MLIFTAIGLLLIGPIANTAQYNLLGANPTLMKMRSASSELCFLALIIHFVLYSTNRYIRRNLSEDNTHTSTLQKSCIFICVVFVILSRCMQFNFGSDDSYVFFRYARNFSNGLGPVYNAGERILGFSSFAYMALITFTQSIINGDVMPARILNLILQTESIWLLQVLGFRLWSNRWLTILALLLYALSPYLISENARLQETSLVCLLILSSLLAYQRGKLRVFAWSAATIFLTRMEGLFFLASSVVASFIKEGRQAFKLWIQPAIFVGIVYLTVFMYFKSILPHGALAKMKTFYNVPWFMSPGDVLVGMVRTCFDFPGQGTVISDHPILSIVQIPTWQIAVTFVEAFAILIVGIILARKRPWLAIYFYPTMLIALFLTRAPVMFSWYLSWFALMPCLLLPSLVEALSTLATKPRTKWLTLPAVSVVVVYSLMLPFWQYPVNSAGVSTPFFMFPENQDKMIAYKEIGQFANEPFPGKYSPESLAAFEIGRIGFEYRGKIIDLGGLTSEEVLQFYPVPTEMRSDKSIWNIPPKAVTELMPEFVVVTREYEQKGLLRDQKFLTKYKKMKTWQTTMGPIDLYHRQ